MTPLPSDLEQRVLILAATARDAQVTAELLSGGGLSAVVCRGVRELATMIGDGAGAVMVTEEMTHAADVGELLQVVEGQPAWSEVPFVMAMRHGIASPRAARVLRALRNVTLLERPAPMRSVLSAVQAAVRGRLRQYQIRDQIAEISRREAGERAARAEAEHAGRMKDEFLATLSHELRTPLNAILGWAQVLRRESDDPAEVQTGLEVIERNARLQAQLIEDLLDVSRIISGKVRLDVRPLEPAGVVDAAVATVLPAAEAKGIRLRREVEPTASVVADPSRLQQVLWNLLSNAVKFTPTGGQVTVGVRRAGAEVEISVSDTGAGIRPAFLPHVFERFRQADSSTTRAHGGLGLGLAIVRHLAELHGGSVEAASAGEGLGSTFTVRLPLAPAATTDRGAATAGRTAGGDNGFPGAAAAQPAGGPVVAVAAVDLAAASAGATRQPGAADLTGVKVLLVDDDEDARVLANRVLSGCRAEVSTVASAREALALLRVFRPDVLVSDIGMPEMDGYEFLREVRRASPRDAALPAAALTAFARAEDARRALLAGYQTHLVKPVEPAELIAAVAHLAGRARAAAAGVARAGTDGHP